MAGAHIMTLFRYLTNITENSAGHKCRLEREEVQGQIFREIKDTVIEQKGSGTFNGEEKSG